MSQNDFVNSESLDSFDSEFSIVLNEIRHDLLLVCDLNKDTNRVMLVKSIVLSLRLRVMGFLFTFNLLIKVATIFFLRPLGHYPIESIFQVKYLSRWVVHFESKPLGWKVHSVNQSHWNG